jgi:hypothetical protein
MLGINQEVRSYTLIDDNTIALPDTLLGTWNNVHNEDITAPIMTENVWHSFKFSKHSFTYTSIDFNQKLTEDKADIYRYNPETHSIYCKTTNGDHYTIWRLVIDKLPNGNFVLETSTTDNIAYDLTDGEISHAFTLIMHMRYAGTFVKEKP